MGGIELALSPVVGRETALVLAVEPLRSALVASVMARGFAVETCTTPLDAIQILERLGPRIGYALISSVPDGGVALRRLLLDAYPDIKSIVLVS